ncbi:ATP-dependent DNA ligase [Kytococcus schroeteri]|uniref:DNA ligase (ATP) n=1 Tax=Kytococcus schroeteri TaxID=138300 RepID=A0A2I1PAU7_9MICO|nr:ATP-dependent DNA ligase [Kytococcus schroeteri]PKZ41740.1 ATP-dependent DNA ligase [Kytococcus schroeteri]
MPDSPVIPDVMLAKAAAKVPAADALPGGCSYEPKWDGFRVLVVRGAATDPAAAVGEGDDAVDLLGRSGKSLARYFPEVVEKVRAVPAPAIVDGELVVRSGEPGAERLDWDALAQRIHPAASRIERLAAETPGEVICFDLLADAGGSLLERPFAERRERLAALVGGLPASGGVHLTRATTDPGEAADWFTRFEGAGLDGIMAKGLDTPYEPGKRTMLKVKHKRTADAVVVGYRVHKSGTGVGSLLLGLWSGDQLVPVGGASAFTTARRAELEAELQPWVVREADGSVASAERARNRFTSGKDTSYVPLRPERVVEVAFDQLEGHRFRHAVRFLRWRDDKDAAQCTLEQVDVASGYDLDAVLAADS